MEFNENWKNLYFELKDLTMAYKEWYYELKKENLMLREMTLREKIKNPPIEPPSKFKRFM